VHDVETALAVICAVVQDRSGLIGAAFLGMRNPKPTAKISHLYDHAPINMSNATSHSAEM
jgi:hypothetical protein